MPAEPSGLAGLRIGTPGRFGSSWHALLALLDAGGLTEDDVTIREYPQFNQVEGLLNGDVDLITGFRANEPLRLEAQGFEVAADDGRRLRAAARTRDRGRRRAARPQMIVRS